MDVAVVDYRSPSAPEEFTQSLLETGFAVLVNHPLPQELVQFVYDEWLAFFRTENKHSYRFTDERQGGYYPPSVSETAKGQSKRDLKEFFHVRPGGVFPTEVSRAAFNYRLVAMEVNLALLGWVDRSTPDAIGDQLSQSLQSMMVGSTQSLLRILHYPPLTGGEEQGAVRAAAHEDINLLTVLPASNESGLQLLDKLGRWHDVPCDFGSIAVNSGDMLNQASKGYYPSTTHRVVNPSGDGALRSRMSMPMFLHPADDVVLDPDGPVGRRTAGEFLQERLRELRSEDTTTRTAKA